MALNKLGTSVAITKKQMSWIGDMSRNENQTCKELIEPALKNAGWEWEREVVIGPGRVNITGETMYDETQAIIADYLLRYRSIPLAILEAKAESESAADGMQQASRYARRLLIRFSIASNGMTGFSPITTPALLRPSRPRRPRRHCHAHGRHH